MKKIILLSLLAMMTMAATAQLMIRGGVNYSDINIDNSTMSEVFDRKPGFHVGLNGNLPIGNILNLRPALLYNIKGAEVDNGGTMETMNLHYLELPVNLGIKLGPLVVEAGPYYGYLLNADTGIFNQDSFEKQDWGANFGAVLQLRDLGIGANYSNSLSNVARGDQWEEATKLTNGNLSIFLTYRL